MKRTGSALLLALPGHAAGRGGDWPRPTPNVSAADQRRKDRPRRHPDLYPDLQQHRGALPARSLAPGRLQGAADLAQLRVPVPRRRQHHLHPLHLLPDADAHRAAPPARRALPPPGPRVRDPGLQRGSGQGQPQPGRRAALRPALVVRRRLFRLALRRPPAAKGRRLPARRPLQARLPQGRAAALPRPPLHPEPHRGGQHALQRLVRRLLAGVVPRSPVHLPGQRERRRRHLPGLRDPQGGPVRQRQRHADHPRAAVRAAAGPFGAGGASAPRRCAAPPRRSGSR